MMNRNINNNSSSNSTSQSNSGTPPSFGNATSSPPLTPSKLINGNGSSGSGIMIGTPQQPMLSPTLLSNGVPSIDLIKTPLVKNRVEIDFSAKASKEGLFSMWTSCSDKKINYGKDLTVKIEPPPLEYDDNSDGNGNTMMRTTTKGILSPSLNSTISGGSNSNNNTISMIQSTQYEQEDLTKVFENIHNCIFYQTSTNVNKDIVQQQNGFFVQLIKEDPSNVKSIVSTLFQTFGYYRSISLKEETDDPKRFGCLSLALEKFIEDTLNRLRDASEYTLQNLQKQFTNHLTEQFKKTGNGTIDANIFNDNLQKFNYILSQAVESVESTVKSKTIRAAIKLDPYHEKTAIQKSKALSCKEFYLFQLKHRKLNIEQNPFYGRSNFAKESQFQQWRKFEENSIARLQAQVQPREDYLKSIWGIKYKDRDTIGIISIKVVQARDLIQKEGSSSNSKPEPYLEIDFNDEKKRTRKVTSLNPVWKEHFSFQITKSNQNMEMEFNIWEDGKEEKGNFLGKYKFTAKELMSFVKREVNWYPLQKRSSRSKVSGDVRLQFHFLVFPDSSTPYLNHFNYYKILLEKLIIMEMNSGSNNNNEFNSPTTTSSTSSSRSVTSTTSKRIKAFDPNRIVSVLSPKSIGILREYAERYGLLDHTTKILTMEILVKFIVKDFLLEYIPEVRGILKHVLEAKFGEIGLTIIEEKLLKESIEKLSVACRVWISHFHAVFPLNQPPGSLRMLIDIYYLLRGSELTQILPPLPQLLRDIYEMRYNQALVMVQDMKQQQTQPFGEAASLFRICDILLFNVDIDQKYFSRDFPNESNIMLTSIDVYTKKLSLEIDKLTEVGANNTVELSEFLELYFKLKETMSKFRDIYPKLESLPIPVLFKQCVMQWTLHSADQLKQLVDKLCMNEKWDPISEDTLHSKSVGEVFLGCYHALDVIKSLRWEDLQKYHKDGEHSLFEIFSNFTMVISESIIYYTDVIKEKSLKALDDAADDIFLLSDSYSPNLVKTIQQVSLRFNNIQACLGHTEDLIQVLLRIMASYKLSPSIVNEMAKNSYLAINNNVRTLVDRIYDRLSPVITGEVYRIAGIDLDRGKNVVVDFFKTLEKNLDFTQLAANTVPVSVQLTPLLEYIASKLQLFSQYLYYPLTKQLLKRLWAGIINLLDEMIFPKDSKGGKKLELTMQQIDSIDAMVKCFGEFFFVDGEGLSQKAIDKQSERFMVILMAYREAIRSGVRDFDPLGLKKALQNINLANLKPDLSALRKLNINLKAIPKQLDIFSLIKNTIERKQKERKEREERISLRKAMGVVKSKLHLNNLQQINPLNLLPFMKQQQQSPPTDNNSNDNNES